MDKAYLNFVWYNAPSTQTPLNKTNLDLVSQGLNIVDDRVIALNTLKANASDILQDITTVTLDNETGVMTFTRQDGSTITLNTSINKIATNFTYDSVNQRLVLTLKDGTTQYVSLSDFITDYEFVDSGTIAFTVGQDGTVSAGIKNGSVTEQMLDTNFLAQINQSKAQAQAAATQALGYADNAHDDALLAESHNHGNTGVRDNEATDNSYYYKNQSQAWSTGTIDGVPVESTAPQYRNNAKYWAEQAQTAAQASPMTGATDNADGTSGFVPQPLAGDNHKVLWGDGVWRKAGHTIMDENGTSYNARTNLKFVNAEIQDDAVSDTTVITVQGGGGAALPDVTSTTISTFGEQVSLTWTDPNDIVVDGMTLAAWAGTLVVRKVGSEPQNRLDGTVVVNNTTRNTYQSTAFVDNTVEYGNTYYYKFFPYTTASSYTSGTCLHTTVQRIETPIPVQATVPVYDGTVQSPTWTGYDTDKMTLVSGGSATEAGTHTAVFTILDGYCWVGGSVADQSVTWRIADAALNTPTIADLTYNGGIQTATATGFDSNYMNISGNVVTNVGHYLAHVNLIDENVLWSDERTITVQEFIDNVKTKEYTTDCTSTLNFDLTSVTDSNQHAGKIIASDGVNTDTVEFTFEKGV